MKLNVAQVFSQITTALLRLSGREQMYIVIALGIAVSMGAARLINTTKSHFSQQKNVLNNLQQNAGELGGLIRSYLSTLQRKRDIEGQYEQIGQSDGSLSYLERTVNTIVGVSPEISSLPARPFGVRYEQIPFRVQFRTRESNKLFSLLGTLTRGTQRYLITKIEISPRIDKQLDVVMELSSLALKENKPK